MKNKIIEIYKNKKIALWSKYRQIFRLIAPCNGGLWEWIELGILKISFSSGILNWWVESIEQAIKTRSNGCFFNGKSKSQIDSPYLVICGKKKDNFAQFKKLTGFKWNWIEIAKKIVYFETLPWSNTTWLRAWVSILKEMFV